MLDIKVQDGVVSLAGRFDASQAGNARAALEQVDRSVTVDLAELEYISSAGIGILMGTYRRLHSSGGTMKLVNLNPRVRNVFRLSGLDKVLVIE